MEQKVALAILLITSIVLGSIGGVTSSLLGTRTGPQGPQGEQGPAGMTGATGATGLTGATGATGLTGATGATGPAGPAGADGANGADGADGSVWWNGPGAPDSSLGVDGDFYLDLNNGDVYNRISGSWTLVANIQGPDGPQGEQGPAGPQGDTGPQGPQGDTGPQGPQGDTGLPGADGINSIITVIYNRNSTIFETQSYPAMQWVNMSELDSSMMINIDIQQNSRLLIQFSASISIISPGSLQTRIVVDNTYTSTVSMNSVSSASTGTIKFSDHIEFVTDPLNTGTHTINLQVLRENGSPIILDRTITIMEINSP
jgi:hypothetical protein